MEMLYKKYSLFLPKLLIYGNHGIIFLVCTIFVAHKCGFYGHFLIHMKYTFSNVIMYCYLLFQSSRNENKLYDYDYIIT